MNIKIPVSSKSGVVLMKGEGVKRELTCFKRKERMKMSRIFITKQNKS
jgi:hypothetical protein